MIVAVRTRWRWQRREDERESARMWVWRGEDGVMAQGEDEGDVRGKGDENENEGGGAARTEGKDKVRTRMRVARGALRPHHIEPRSRLTVNGHYSSTCQWIRIASSQMKAKSWMTICMPKRATVHCSSLNIQYIVICIRASSRTDQYTFDKHPIPTIYSSDPTLYRTLGTAVGILVYLLFRVFVMQDRGKL